MRVRGPQGEKGILGLRELLLRLRERWRARREGFADKRFARLCAKPTSKPMKIFGLKAADADDLCDALKKTSW